MTNILNGGVFNTLKMTNYNAHHVSVSDTLMFWRKWTGYECCEYDILFATKYRQLDSWEKWRLKYNLPHVSCGLTPHKTLGEVLGSWHKMLYSFEKKLRYLSKEKSVIVHEDIGAHEMLWGVSNFIFRCFPGSLVLFSSSSKPFSWEDVKL